MPKKTKTDLGAVVTSDLAPPNGGTLADPQPGGPLLPGARPVKAPATPKPRGRKDAKTSRLSAPVPTIGDQG